MYLIIYSGCMHDIKFFFNLKGLFTFNGYKSLGFDVFYRNKLLIEDCSLILDIKMQNFNFWEILAETEKSKNNCAKFEFIKMAVLFSLCPVCLFTLRAFYCSYTNFSTSIVLNSYFFNMSQILTTLPKAPHTH